MKYSSLDNLAETLSFCILKKGKIENFGHVLQHVSRWALKGICNTSISTDIYFKSTDSKQYLNFKSCHPKHTKVNIPFSLARRIWTIVSDISVRNVRLKE